jgi:hypothetical protein
VAPVCVLRALVQLARIRIAAESAACHRPLTDHLATMGLSPTTRPDMPRLFNAPFGAHARGLSEQPDDAAKPVTQCWLLSNGLVNEGLTTSPYHSCLNSLSMVSHPTFLGVPIRLLRTHCSQRDLAK